jgi:hypothetical protein
MHIYFNRKNRKGERRARVNGARPGRGAFLVGLGWVCEIARVVAGIPTLFSGIKMNSIRKKKREGEEAN